MKETETQERWSEFMATQQETVSETEPPCEFCGGDVGKYGTSICPQCGETKCVAECIPGGRGTYCNECDGEI